MSVIHILFELVKYQPEWFDFNSYYLEVSCEETHFHEFMYFNQQNHICDKTEIKIDLQYYFKLMKKQELFGIANLTIPRKIFAKKKTNLNFDNLIFSISEYDLKKIFPEKNLYENLSIGVLVKINYYQKKFKLKRYNSSTMESYSNISKNNKRSNNISLGNNRRFNNIKTISDSLTSLQNNYINSNKTQKKYFFIEKKTLKSSSMGNKINNNISQKSIFNTIEKCSKKNFSKNKIADKNLNNFINSEKFIGFVTDDKSNDSSSSSSLIDSEFLDDIIVDEEKKEKKNFDIPNVMSKDYSLQIFINDQSQKDAEINKKIEKNKKLYERIIYNRQKNNNEI